MLPESTILGKLNLIEVYEFYDMPILFACENKAGHTYLAVWVDEAVDKDTWLYVSLSRKRFQRIRAGEIDLHDAFAKSEDEIVLEVIIYRNPNRESQVEPLSIQDLDENWLPLSGDYLNILDSLPYVLKENVDQTSTKSRAKVRQPVTRPWNWYLQTFSGPVYSGVRISHTQTHFVQYSQEIKPFRHKEFEDLRKRISHTDNFEPKKDIVPQPHWGNIDLPLDLSLNDLCSLELRA
jgi:hypothetical protein